MSQAVAAVCISTGTAPDAWLDHPTILLAAIELLNRHATE